MRKRSPIRRDGDAVVVALPARIRDLVASVAESVRREAQDPEAAGYRQLYTPVAGDPVSGDPLVGLRRQLAVDQLCDTVERTVRLARLTDDEAEAWLRVLGLAVTLRAAEAGIVTDADVGSMDGRLSRALDLLRSLQVLLAFSLDPALEDSPTFGTEVT